jgi:hypothetical protein
VLGGSAEKVQEDAPYFVQHCRLRTKPLVPTNHPIAALEQLLLAIPDPHDSGEHRLLVQQFLLLVDTVYRPFGNDGPQRIRHGNDFEAQLKRIRTDFDKLDVRWDVKTSRYVFAKDGSTLP